VSTSNPHIQGFQGDAVEDTRTASDGTCLEADKIALIAANDWMENSPLVGRESQINELRKYADRARTESFQVMSVWGITGVGKSTLVKDLYYYTMLNGDQFTKHSWVDVM
jgi:hypothetical protein